MWHNRGGSCIFSQIVLYAPIKCICALESLGYLQETTEESSSSKHLAYYSKKKDQIALDGWGWEENGVWVRGTNFNAELWQQRDLSVDTWVIEVTENRGEQKRHT